MNEVKLIEDLMSKLKIDREQAKNALEQSNWNSLDAVVYLEQQGVVKKPKITVFYSNKAKEEYVNSKELVNLKKTEEGNFKGKKDFKGFFEIICNIIDSCNNIFIEIKRKNNLILKLPFTVLIVLLFFIFWIIIPLFVVSLFFDVEFLVVTKVVDAEKINRVLKEIFHNVQRVKEKIKKEIK